MIGTLMVGQVSGLEKMTEADIERLGANEGAAQMLRASPLYRLPLDFIQRHAHHRELWFRIDSSRHTEDRDTLTLVYLKDETE